MDRFIYRDLGRIAYADALACQTEAYDALLAAQALSSRQGLRV